MLNRNLWETFENELSIAQIECIEKRIIFFKDNLEDAERQYNVEDVSRDLDLDIHGYLNYFNLAGAEGISPWLIHDAWLYYYDDGEGLLPEIRKIIVFIFNETNQDLYIQIVNLLKCIELVDLIVTEADAVVVLSFMDYLATQMLHSIGRNRIRKVLQLPNTVAKYDMNKL